MASPLRLTKGDAILAALTVSDSLTVQDTLSVKDVAITGTVTGSYGTLQTTPTIALAALAAGQTDTATDTLTGATTAQLVIIKGIELGTEVPAVVDPETEEVITPAYTDWSPAILDADASALTARGEVTDDDEVTFAIAYLGAETDFTGDIRINYFVVSA